MSEYRFRENLASDYSGDPDPTVAPSYPDAPTTDRRSARAVAAAFRHAARHHDGTSADPADSFGP